jgi:hypothetical protein
MGSRSEAARRGTDVKTDVDALGDGDRFGVPDILPGFSVTVDELWPE